jgi:glyoxylase-like metal-dependent hydrolase (beta-lactamase superfamily II)
MFERDAAKGVHRIEDAYTNWYLLEEDGRFTVVDCGIRASWKSLATALVELHASLDDIEAIVLTHAHFDHTGFAERLRVERQIPVWVHENDAPLTKHPLQYGHARSRIPYLFNPKSLPIAAAMFAGRAFWPTPIKEVRTFTEGDDLPVPGSPEIVYTPGHTLGHCAFHLPDRDAVIAGDAVVMLDPYMGAKGPRIVSAAATVDVERNLRTLDAIAETGAQIVLTGHGDTWFGGAAEAVRLAREAGPN